MATPVVLHQDSTYINVDYYNDTEGETPAYARLNLGNPIVEVGKQYTLNFVRAQVPLHRLPIRTSNDSPPILTVMKISDSTKRSYNLNDSTIFQAGANTVKECVVAANFAMKTIFDGFPGGTKESYPRFRITGNGIQLLIPKWAAFTATRPNYMMDYAYFGNFEFYSQFLMAHDVRVDTVQPVASRYRWLPTYETIDSTVTINVSATTTQEFYVFEPAMDSSSNMFSSDTLIIQCSLPTRYESTGAFTNTGSSQPIEMLTDFSLLQVVPGSNVIILPQKDRLVNLMSTPTNIIEVNVLYRNKSGRIAPLMMGPHTHLGIKFEIREVM